jgi:capsular polysaccharide export protein
VSAHRLAAYKGKRVLLLQGPIGPFFRRLAADLRWSGAQVCKVNFNGGDCLFYPLGAISYRGRMNEWPGYLSRLIIERHINVIMLLGDCRPIHSAVHAIASRHHIEVEVFEEGYVRPDYITLERGGVNGYSHIPRTPLFYLNNPIPTVPDARAVPHPFRYVILWSVLYYLAGALLYPFFRHYRHHRPLTLLEAFPWIRGYWRKLYYKFRERGVGASLRGERSGQYFLVPLQVHNDAQIHMHSRYHDVPDFIHEVMRSFAAHAPPKTSLVFKHHPLDRGYREYARSIRAAARKLGIADRVTAIHDQHLPSLLEHARGVVVINSTVGFSAIHHDTPVKACGTAVYDMQGLTFQGTLDAFWKAAAEETIDRELYVRFRNYLIDKTQANGSFYKPLDIPGSHSGLVWPSEATGNLASSDSPERHVRPSATELSE